MSAATTDRSADLERNVASLGRRDMIDLGDGTELDYWVTGSGPPIVLLHGLLGTALHWSIVAPILAENYTVYTPELPFGGHDRPVGGKVDVSVVGQAKLVSRFCAALELEGVCIVGNDTGGTIAQIIAVERPTAVTRVVISDSDAFENLPPTVFKYLCWMARLPALVTISMKVLARLHPLQRLPFAFGWLSKHGVPRAIAEHYLTLFTRTGATRDDLVRFLRDVDSTPTRAVAARFHAVDCPVLVLWSRDDKVFPHEHGQRIAALIPGARIQTCDDAYAYLPIDQPDWFARHVARFHDAA